MKSYGQFCGLARALDHVGDRWTLLIIRELLLGDATYSALQRALDDIPTNLLARRLKSLQHDGLVHCVTDETDHRRRRYVLTERGRALEPAVLELVRWGAQWMSPGRGHDSFDDRWTFLAMRALLDGRTVPTGDGVIEIRAADDRWGITVIDAIVRVDRQLAPADTIVTGDAEILLGLIAGELTWTAAKARGIRITGRHDLARAALAPDATARSGTMTHRQQGRRSNKAQRAEGSDATSPRTTGR